MLPESREVCASTEGGMRAAMAAAAAQRVTVRLRPAVLTEALEQLPELDRAEIVEAAEQLLLGGCHEDPPRRASSLGGDEMDPAANRGRSGRGLEVDAPGQAP